VTVNRDKANQQALERMTSANPVLVDVQRAVDVVPGMKPNLVLTSGAPLEWPQYHGAQRLAVIYGAMYEGLADNVEEADEKLHSGSIQIGMTHDYGCVGSVAGIYTASMPVFVVHDRTSGRRAFCNFYEGDSPRRLNYGSYGDDVIERLRFIDEVVAPTIGKAVRRSDGIDLRPIIRRAIHMGDELHSRNSAATLLFTRALFPFLLDVAKLNEREVRSTLEFLEGSQYSFLRLSMAASKATADATHGVDGSSVLTGMTISCREFAIRVSGLGEREWFRGPLPDFEGKLLDGVSEEDVAWMGGESHITETVGLGGFVQAAAFPLQAYQGGSPEVMIERNLSMYEITVGEHPEFRIPYFRYRGAPVGIDLFKVLETGITPVIDGGLAKRDGGQAGAGILRASIECFEAAAQAYRERYEGA
jgi:hypothetical protein